ncbi:hypothetical protein BLNAU_3268 [Blattamonas nauphoetae]|uniref:Uncharacterized protein n=1 Tax=Blattamonas nauphoetae TaxID=2049346 RepID=A0ABQ9YDI9_9EUKA|nr:hypothetical protein BLNAU_3268 [Blattamonas nauphoetae]
MTSHDDYSPFMKWNENDIFTVDSGAEVLISLISMIQDGYKFDETLLRQASKCLSWIFQSSNLTTSVNGVFFQTIGQGATDSIPAFVELIDVLLSAIWLSSEHEIQSLSTTSHTDPQSIRDVVLNEVLIPIEPSLVQISRNPLFVSSIYIYHETVKLLVKIFDVSAFHQPTLDFVSSSRIPMAFQTLLSQVEIERTHQFIIWLMSDYLRKWKRDGAETAGKGRILLQALEQEGFHETLEQTLLHDKSSMEGNCSNESEHGSSKPSLFFSCPDRELSVYIFTWKKNGDETVRRGKRTLQMLEKEGFGDELESTLLHTESTTYGHKVRIHSFNSLTFLGINCRL